MAMQRDNRKLKTLFEADQKERSGASIDWVDLNKKDAHRRLVISQMINEKQICTPVDYYRAAMIFQHSGSVEGVLKAQEFANKAMREGYVPAKWLYAAATDRVLVMQNKKQKFGTQFLQTVVIGKDGKVKREWVVYPYDEKVTDAMRKEYNVPSLKELKRRARSVA